MDEFYNYLTRKRNYLVEQGYFLKKEYFKVINDALIHEYDKIINKYMEHIGLYEFPDGIGDANSCKECSHSICFDKATGRMYCGVQGSRVITNPNIIQDWCPYNEVKE